MSSDCALLLPGAKAKKRIDFYISIKKGGVGGAFNLAGHALGFPWLLGVRLLAPVKSRVGGGVGLEIKSVAVAAAA